MQGRSVNCEALYKLSDVQLQFGIPRQDLILRASSTDSSRVRLCLPLTDGYEVRIREVPVVSLPLRDDQDESMTRARSPFAFKGVISLLVLSPEVCRRVMTSGKGTQTDFKEAYGFRWKTEESWSEETPASRVLVWPEDGPLDEEGKPLEKGHYFALYPQDVFWSISDPTSRPRPLKVQIDADSLCIYGAELRRYIEGDSPSEPVMDTMTVMGGQKQDDGQSQQEASVSSAKQPGTKQTANERGQEGLRKIVEVIKVLHMEVARKPFEPLDALGTKEDALPLIREIGDRLGCEKLPPSTGSTFDRRAKGILKFKPGGKQQGEHSIYASLLRHFRNDPDRFTSD